MIDSSGTWSLQQGIQPVLASGAVGGLAVTPGDVKAIDTTGSLAVNGQYVATLDLPAADARGDVAVGADFFLPSTSGVVSLSRTTDSRSGLWIEPSRRQEAGLPPTA
jgi:hypothetical protein